MVREGVLTHCAFVFWCNVEQSGCNIARLCHFCSSFCVHHSVLRPVCFVCL